MPDIAGKRELERLGYKVEDLGVEYGPSFTGKFRWINLIAGMFQQEPYATSADAAWAYAFTHAVTHTPAENRVSYEPIGSPWSYS